MSHPAARRSALQTLAHLHCNKRPQSLYEGYRAVIIPWHTTGACCRDDLGLDPLTGRSDISLWPVTGPITRRLRESVWGIEQPPAGLPASPEHDRDRDDTDDTHRQEQPNRA